MAKQLSQAILCMTYPSIQNKEELFFWDIKVFKEWFVIFICIIFETLTDH